MAPGVTSPFWRYYGGKFRSGPRYPAPAYGTIIEPFAGAAGYAMRYPKRKVILIERYSVIAEMWRYLIQATADEIRRIPVVEHIDDLPGWVPQGARSLVGFSLSSACTSPRRTLSAGKIKLRALGRQYEGWCEAQRERVAAQVGLVKHWTIIEGDYSAAPDTAATWFIDPPYQAAGPHYIHSAVDYPRLADWCRERNGQVIVCEAEGASWLPFTSFGSVKAGPWKGSSREVIWTREEMSPRATAPSPAPQRAVSK
jgi:hypothetical protein